MLPRAGSSHETEDIVEDTIERSSRKAKFLFDFPRGLDVTEKSVKGGVLRVKKASRA